MNLFPFAAITEPLLSGFSNHNSTMATDRAIPLLDAPAEDPHKKFVKNIIISSRYTIWNFFPKSLLEQFRRLANVYFLVLGIIASVGAYTSFYETAIEPAGILAPMIIVVLISVVKVGSALHYHAQLSKLNS